ncbi:MAG TPA: hypothetical protein VLG69_02770 [Candidatus Andersenbacteria bacterium]|nr:hypothetical protein [Candidatus Andersenbacteria bacterium]
MAKKKDRKPSSLPPSTGNASDLSEDVEKKAPTPKSAGSDDTVYDDGIGSSGLGFPNISQSYIKGIHY